MNPSSLSSASVFEEFLRELQTLDDFRAEYAARYEFEGLGRDDPDVARLIEAMAFYRAKTRATVEHGIQEYQLRALEQLFPYLLSPMPAMGILFPELAGNMTDARTLPRHAELTVAPPGAPVREKPPRVMRSVRALTVFPLHVVARSVRLVRQRTPMVAGVPAPGSPAMAPFTLSLDVAPSAIGQESRRYYDDPVCPCNELSFHVNPQGDALTALRLYDALQDSCQDAVVRVYADGQERYQTGPVSVQFRSRLDGDYEANDNPIEAIRRAIHFPLARFCLTVPLIGLPSEWNRLSVEFRLRESWPEGLQVADGSFVLNGVPVENLVRRTAEPIAEDGTRMRSLVQSQEQPNDWRARDVLGVYAELPETPGARVTLLPRSLLDNGYTAIARGSGTNREVWLETDSPLGVVDAPRTVYVDAEWYDPDPVLPNPRTAVVRAEAHDLGPLTWRLLDPLYAPSDSPVLADCALLERLLEIQGEPPGSARELNLLLKVLGAERSELFSRIPRCVDRVVTAVAPDARDPAGTIRSYDVSLSRVPPVLEPAVRWLFSLLPRLLSVWTGEPSVQVCVTIDSTRSGRPWVFEWRQVGNA